MYGIPATKLQPHRNLQYPSLYFVDAPGNTEVDAVKAEVAYKTTCDDSEHSQIPSPFLHFSQGRTFYAMVGANT